MAKKLKQIITPKYQKSRAIELYATDQGRNPYGHRVIQSKKLYNRKVKNSEVDSKD
jgi:hypothetical protein